ncbi:type II toxin-antitoxin system HicB family antitoxin [Amycolatopsis sp. NPDC058340]|uniref:type II toxin-antitoxin system HicB family antitoxin n=1 Tax=Amycolatopsis sp. NPDC058340 TaxID=3346453 RepID=UPI003649F4C8
MSVLVTGSRDAHSGDRVSAAQLLYSADRPCEEATLPVRVVAEGNGWSAFIPGVPVAVDGESFDETMCELVDALRVYAEDWQLRLRDAPNHRDNHGLVQLIKRSDEDQLRDWLSLVASGDSGSSQGCLGYLPAAAGLRLTVCEGCGGVAKDAFAT